MFAGTMALKLFLFVDPSGKLRIVRFLNGKVIGLNRVLENISPYLSLVFSGRYALTHCSAVIAAPIETTVSTSSPTMHSGLNVFDN